MAQDRQPTDHTGVSGGPTSLAARPDETPLRIVVVGHVDHGKSTLIGRLFYDTDSLPEGKYESIRDTCKRRGVPFEWAFLMDALQSERDQNITIDSAQIWFRTEARPYVIIDAPGHREFLKNMITGAAAADAALLLIAADEGVQEQSRRHGYMLSLLGIRQVVVVVNKMDLVDYDQGVFEQIESDARAFLKQIDVEPQTFVPISAREGHNIASHDAGEHDDMPWYEGDTVLELLDGFEMPAPRTDQPLRFPVQDVYRFDERRIVAGRIEAGTLEVGDELVFSPTGESSIVRAIERWHAPTPDAATADESIGITLEDQLFVERGHIGTHPDTRPSVSNRLRANVFWMGRQPLVPEKTYKLKLATQEVDCRIARFVRVIDASTLETDVGDDGEPPSAVERNDVAELVLETKSPIAFDLHADIETLGRFVLVDQWDVSGGGIIVEALEAQTVPWEGELHRDSIHSMAVETEVAGPVLWLHGPPNIANPLADTLHRALARAGRRAYTITNDALAQGLNRGLELDVLRDRREAARRGFEAARFVALSGSHAIVALNAAPDVAPRGVRVIEVDVQDTTSKGDKLERVDNGGAERWTAHAGSAAFTVADLTRLVEAL